MATMKNRAIEETKKRRSKRLNIRFALVALRATRIPTAAGHPPGNRQPALDALAPCPCSSVEPSLEAVTITAAKMRIARIVLRAV
jgi:hypothetical protein